MSGFAGQPFGTESADQLIASRGAAVPDAQSYLKGITQIVVLITDQNLVNVVRVRWTARELP